MSIDTPLYDALLRHIQRNPISFHVPGHKNGTFFHEKGHPFFHEILKLDVTELTNLDDLHAPEGVIKDAQKLAARFFDVQSTYFLVNGSTVGNLAMILACCQEGDVVLVQRNCHKSIIHGIQLAGATPVFLAPVVDEDLQVPSYVLVETVRQAINQYPMAKALIVTNPNYYGLSYTKLDDVVEYAHQWNIPVLVDEAHGAHFCVSSVFPTSAIEAGADIVIQSAHKTLPALTMGSYLHFNSKLIKEEDVKKYLSILQSSSPSYIIMASLDLARAYMEKMQFEEDEVNKTINHFTDHFRHLKGLRIVKSNDSNVNQDPLKLTARSTEGLTGYDLQQVFEDSSLFPELADPFNMLLILPLTTLDERSISFKQIEDKLSYIQNTLRGKEVPFIPLQNSLVSLGVPYKELEKRNKRYVSLHEAVGNLCAEMIIPYPPGIPLLMIGERITNDHIVQMKALLQMNVKIQGGSSLRDNTILIYE
ncbi:aminotransferase class I/II-fold pyridoxal phosphate-dependent enzyme [Bacillus sp. FJAT-47783]|uniref:aminotransferase class I/II-fold pyridoxal phosphate-dependent enzyme n=1 Tax=Bacillus sp. FJAT-47783 TaxID=2922712 RepID=UPI001FAD3BD8|nr:aminotransferase class I/II-fold pyridoxal phosphate-dependent enzyme [Bacillus sp. FJAT-47783]